MGRPKKTLKDLPKDWERIILDNMAEGASCEEVMGMLGIFEGLWQRFLKEEPKFSQTVKNGKALCRMWWERKGRKNLENKEFSFVGWYMNMKNRFGWKDKQEHKHEGSMINITISDKESKV